MALILGIDPGSRVAGYGVIQAAGNKLQYVASGCIRVDTSRDLAYRLRQINESVTKLIEAIEAAAVKDIPVYEYAARSVKQAVTGKGSADKQQVQKMMQPC